VLRQIIILKEKGFSNRAISGQLSLSRKTTGKYIEFVKQSQLAADELLQLTDVELNVLVDTRTRKPVKDYLQVLYHIFLRSRETAQAGWGYPSAALAGVQTVVSTRC